MRIARLSPFAVRMIQIAFVVGFLALWEVGVQTKALDKFFYSQPSLVFGRIADWVASGKIWDHMLITLSEMLRGFALGTLVGVILGFILGRSANLGAIFEPLLVMLNSMPRVVLAPLFILWFGLGDGSKVVYAFVLVLFPVFFATFTGVREVDQNYIDNVRILGAQRGDLTRHVLIPSALTWIFASLRISVGFALIGAVVGEYLAATKGIGYLIAFAEASFDTTGVFAGLIVLMAMVVVIDNI
ncbi:MAG: ABC transporter permease, partial [Chloroflexi bacterium]|nr:ABC transporter permease [Chloroflexota bacterium]